MLDNDLMMQKYRLESKLESFNGVLESFQLEQETIRNTNTQMQIESKEMKEVQEEHD